jgi:hypothetical protein
VHEVIIKKTLDPCAQFIKQWTDSTMKLVGCVLRSLHHAREFVYAQRGLNPEKILAILVQCDLPERLRKSNFAIKLLMPLDKAASMVSKFEIAENLGTQHTLIARQSTVMRYFPSRDCLPHVLDLRWSQASS